MNTVNNVIAAAIALVLAALLALTFWYRAQYHNTQQTLDATREQIKTQRAQADQALAMLTAARDAKQSAIDKAYYAQEKKDAAAQSEIDRLNTALRERPVRVRIQCPASGERGDSATNNTHASADSGARNTTQTYGVLPEKNSERLANAITEIEQLSAAYNSCHDTLTDSLLTR